MVLKNRYVFKGGGQVTQASRDYAKWLKGSRPLLKGNRWLKARYKKFNAKDWGPFKYIRRRGARAIIRQGFRGWASRIRAAKSKYFNRTFRGGPLYIGNPRPASTYGAGLYSLASLPSRGKSFTSRRFNYSRAKGVSFMG